MTKVGKDGAIEATEKKPKVEKDYTISIINIYDDMPVFTLTTKVRKLAGAMNDLCAENGLGCEVTVNSKPKLVKFRGK